jgi:hypothetical protein
MSRFTDVKPASASFIEAAGTSMRDPRHRRPAASVTDLTHPSWSYSRPMLVLSIYAQSRGVRPRSRGGHQRGNMSFYRRGDVYRYEFRFNGQRIQESSQTSNKDAARQIEDAHHVRLAKGGPGIIEGRRRPHSATSRHASRKRYGRCG